MQVVMGRWHSVDELYRQARSPHATLISCYKAMVERYGENTIEIRFESIDGSKPVKTWEQLLRGALKRLMNPSGSRHYDFSGPPTKASSNDKILFEMRKVATPEKLVRLADKDFVLSAAIEAKQISDRISERLGKSAKQSLPKESIEPTGCLTPYFQETLVRQYDRCAKVRSYVLQCAAGTCECCMQRAPFTDGDGQPYLEVHHLKPLAEGGSDTVDNAVGVCPNCHRALHYASDRLQKLRKLCAGNPRLKFPEE